MANSIIFSFIDEPLVLIINNFTRILNANSIQSGFSTSNDMLSLATEVYYEIDGQIRASILIFEEKAFLGLWFELLRRNGVMDNK